MIIKREFDLSSKYFDAILKGDKKAELYRSKSINYGKGDVLKLVEVDITQGSNYLIRKTGRIIFVKITDVVVANETHPELPEGNYYLVMSFEIISAIDNEKGLVLM